MLVTSKEILDNAYSSGYAVGAFNVVNLEMAKAVVGAALEERSPVILQTTEGAINYAGIRLLSGILKCLAETTPIPIAVHLDHGSTFESVVCCIRNGYTSVMFDGSREELDVNIGLTKKVVEVAHFAGVSVEAELGIISGVESGVCFGDTGERYTNPEEAFYFAKETSVDCLAVAIGTAHGEYEEYPNLRLDILKNISELVNIPLVLHGASGLDDDNLVAAVQMGVSKINFDTDLRIAFTSAARAIFLGTNEIDLRKIFSPSVESVAEVVRKKIKILGSNNRV